MKQKIENGTKVKFSFDIPVIGTVTFTAVVCNVLQNGTAWVEMPKRIRELKPVAPLGGKRYGLYKIIDLKKI